MQQAGRGPLLLLLHGTGGSAHSWSGLLPALAEHATVVVPDLPGHGFTRGAAVADLTLPRMAQALRDLLTALQLPAPAIVVGHSAGAALALRLALDEPANPPAVLGFAPSLVAPPAAYTQWVAPLLNPLATSTPVALLMSRFAGPMGFIDSLLKSTGSPLTAEQRQPYKRLFAQAAHVRGAVGFMAAADLPRLCKDCMTWSGTAAFVLGAQDRWIPETALRPVLQRALPRADVQVWPGGHLVHEEQPAKAAARVLALLKDLASSAD